MKKAFFLLACFAIFVQCTVSQTENQIIFKELFTNYFEADTNKIIIVSENYKSLFERKTDTMLCTILKKERKNNILYAITSITPNGNNDFSTSPFLGIAEFQIKDNKIQNFINYTQYAKEGSWGEVPPFEIKFAGKEKTPILIIVKGSTNQGITSENTLGYTKINDQVIKVLEIKNTYEDNTGNCEEDEENCYRYKTELIFSDDTLIAIKKGTLYNYQNDSLMLINKKSIYIFKNGIYSIDEIARDANSD